MYGTVARIKLKPGSLDKLLGVIAEMDREWAPKIEGDRGGLVFQLDKDENTIMLVAIFENKELYLANADNPEQDKWYRRMAEHFDGEPEWNDGQIVYTSLQ